MLKPMTDTLSLSASDPGPAGPAVVPRPVRTPRWWGPAAVTAAGASLLVVTAWWVRNGGVHAVDSFGGPSVIALGRLAGLYASDLMLLQVLLLARIPLVERAFGQDQLAHWHRRVGFASFDLLLAHVALITLGYAGTEQANVVVEFWTVVANYPGMLLAAVGTAFLVLVVVTSVRAARRRLRYESWHLLHLYAYLGVGLALPHQIWNGGDFMGSGWARAYWWSLYAVTAGALVTYRLALPAWRSWRHELRVSRVVAEGPGLTSVYLTGRDLDQLPIRAGQFFQWRFRTGPGWSRAHPYSLSALPGRDLLRITVKSLGDDSARVATLLPGTRVLFEGPYGRLTGDAYRGGPVTMFACGIGITPLLALLYELPYGPQEATLVYRARSEEEVAFRPELDELASRRGVRVVYLLGPRAPRLSWLPADTAGVAEFVGSGDDLTDIDALLRIVPNPTAHRLYVCGPDSWTEAVVRAAWDAGVPPKRVHLEWFSW